MTCIKKFFSRIVDEYKIVIPLFVIFILASILAPGSIEKDNLLNILRQISVLTIISIGMTLVIITGGIDLSVGSIMALVSVFVAFGIRNDNSLAFLFIVALFIGIGCGLVNGLFIMNNTVPSFLKFPVRLYL